MLKRAANAVRNCRHGAVIVQYCWALPAISVAGCLLATALCDPRPRLLWNASASVPRGLYRVSSLAALRRGDLVLARMPAALTDLAARRRYIPRGVPLIKRIAALEGDHVCATNGRLRINGHLVATVFVRDAAGRPLPRWNTCSRLLPGTVLLLGDDSHSFDSRYFGPIRTSDVLGTAALLWRA